MTPASKTVRAAYAVAFLMAAYLLLAAISIGPLVAIYGALIAGISGFGIMRGRVWSAYGLALFISLQVTMIPLVLSRSSSNDWLMLVGSGAFNAALAVLFFRAGRLLETAGGVRGLAWPWIAVSVLFSLPVLFVQAFVIPSASMENTVLLGDRLFVRVWPKPQPERDEIWAFHYPLNRRETYLKRIVGMPGDRIRLSNKALYRNGSALTEPYVKHLEYVDSYRDNFPAGPLNVSLPPPAEDMLEKNVANGEVVVPRDCYFVLGDNRDDSSDSRYWGFVAASDLIGKPFLVYDSREMPPMDLTRLHALTIEKPRWNRFFKLL